MPKNDLEIKKVYLRSMRRYDEILKDLQRLGKAENDLTYLVEIAVWYESYCKLQRFVAEWFSSRNIDDTLFTVYELELICRVGSKFSKYRATADSLVADLVEYE